MRRVVGNGLLSLLCAALTACAGAGRGSSCAPLEEHFLVAGPAYRDCAVSLQAEPLKAPRVEWLGRPEGTSGCFSVLYDIVVDTTGRFALSTAKLVRTTNASYADAVKRQLHEVQYRPAVKDGQRVQQLVRYKSAVAYMIVAVPAGQTRPPSSARPPRC